jgi:hypothetical protein
MDERSPREMCKLNELIEWVFFSKNESRSVGLDYKDVYWDTGLEVVSLRWHSHKTRRLDHVSRPEPTPEDWVAFFDHTQKWIEQIPGDRQDW